LSGEPHAAVSVSVASIVQESMHRRSNWQLLCRIYETASNHDEGAPDLEALAAAS